MKVQRARLPETDKTVWLVLDDNYLPIQPIQQFLTYLEHIERSPNTIQSYAYHLKVFWDYLHYVQQDWTAIGLSELADFIAWLRMPTTEVIALDAVACRSESTINTILVAVTMFYEYHHHEGNVAAIPLYREQFPRNRRYKSFLHHIHKGKSTRTRLLKLKEPRRDPKTLTPQQVQQIIDSCHSIRDKFLMCLLYETGMRIGQALGLRHEDIRSWDNEIQIVPRDTNVNEMRAKSHNPYTIHVSKELMALYTDYLLHEFDEIDSDYVFINLKDGYTGTPMKYITVASLFQRIGKQIGLRIHPHMFRHTHATELIRSGWDMAYVQKRLGHANIQTTMNTYTHLDNEDMKRQYQSYEERRKA